MPDFLGLRSSIDGHMGYRNASCWGCEVSLYITCKAITVGEKINKATLTSDTFNLNNESYEGEEIDV